MVLFGEFSIFASTNRGHERKVEAVLLSSDLLSPGSPGDLGVASLPLRLEFIFI